MKNISILQFKIATVGSKPLIWREILVPADYAFFDLHVAIQDALGWEDSHLHQFFTDDPFKRNGDYQRIAYPMPEAEDVIDEREIKLSQCFKSSKDTLWYEYDFGDSWMHEIKLEQVLLKETGTKYPVLVDGANACPPEDCGGLGGYYNLLDILKKPKHPDYNHIIEWLGIEKSSDFDLTNFDKKDIKFRNPSKVLKQYAKGFGN